METRHRASELALLVDTGRDLTSTLERTEVLDRVVRHARRLIDGAVAALLVEDPEPAADAEGALARRLGERARATGAPIVEESVVALPLRTKDRVVGILFVQRDGAPLRPHEVALLELLAQQAAIAIENAALFAEARAASERMRHSDKLSALGRLSAGLAHELRNPLNTLNVLTFAMRERSEVNASSRADLDVIHSEIQRMNLLLDQFLDFARPRRPRFERHRVEEIVVETVTLVAPEAGKRTIELETRLSPSTPHVWADGDQLKQVFLNLALNALQAMPEGGRLVVESAVTQGGVVVRFRDTGIGIPDEIRDRLFEPFCTSRTGGTGLGLAVALRIVDAHSGDLSVESEPGRGTTASVWLPS
ncbi:MAG: two-component system sensor histidine kinase NtrB [Candidatus Binatia bacterium]